ncbi:MAG: hypothetical protein RBR08_16575 [Desulforegulaceae bacterium]|nr:hypothetical protein [Desulforegulaceae bacterium]
MADEKITNYYLYDIETGKQVESFGNDYVIQSPNPPKIGEYLNQSGCYFEVLTLLQHFDENYVEVYVRSIGSSEDFLAHIQAKFLHK